MSALPLEGLRVLVTRAEDQGAGLVKTLEDLGAAVVWIPALRTEPVEPDAGARAILENLETFAWAAFSSPNAVRHFLGILKGRGMGLPPGVKVAAVGAATEKSLTNAGVPVHAVPDEATGRALAHHLQSLVPPSRLLLPRGRKGREELPEILAAAGWDVVPIVCYDTLPAAISADAAREIASGLDAALFASPSAANNLWAALDGGGREILRRTLLVPIGPTTAQALRDLGLDPTPEAPDHSVPGLVDALMSALGKAETGDGG
jgi:uroporphyrinogen-III synthase